MSLHSTIPVMSVNRLSLKRRLIAPLTVTLLISCLSARAQTPHPVVQEMVDRVSIDSLVKHLRVLTGVDSVLIRDRMSLIDTREMHTFGNALAADYIKQQFYPWMRVFEQLFGGWCFSGRPCGLNENVFAQFFAEGGGFWEPLGPYYIISAHFDSFSRDIHPAPGADDNATGTAAVLEAARVVYEVAFQGPGQSILKHPIVFALWDAEEIGLEGSNYYAREAVAGGDDILGVVNLDMLGYDPNEDGDFWIIGSSGRPGFANLLLELNDLYEIGLGLGTVEWDLGGSDHRPFQYYGYPAVTLTESWWAGDVNDYHHTAADTLGHLNLDTYQKMTKLAVAAIAHLAMTEERLGTPVEAISPMAHGLALMQNYPNPFRESTIIRFALPERSQVKLVVFDVMGRKVEEVTDGQVSAGIHSIVFTAENLPAGAYTYRLEAEGVTLSRAMVKSK